MNNQSPCIKCITLAICKPIGIKTNGVATLAMKCSILDKWLTKYNEWDIELMYKAYLYFKRGNL